jgi:hypothetical protein
MIFSLFFHALAAKKPGIWFVAIDGIAGIEGSVFTGH